MAIAKKCDRCGNYYEVYNVKFTLCKIDTGLFEIKNDIDLCPDCCEQFNKWLKNKDMRPIAIQHTPMGTTCEE